MTTPVALAEEALAGREELALLAEPSARRVATMLAERCRDPAPWIRSALGTLFRFGAEVADGDLGALLDRGLLDVRAAEESLSRLAARHHGSAAGLLPALSFGPKLWWRLSGVPIPWREFTPTAGVAPIAGGAVQGAPAALDTRLVLLALLGTGLTAEELLSVRVGDAGSLDAGGRLIPDLAAEPLALEYEPADGGERLLTFLPSEARATLLQRLRARAAHPGDPLLLAAESAAAASRSASRQTGSSPPEGRPAAAGFRTARDPSRDPREVHR